MARGAFCCIMLETSGDFDAWLLATIAYDFDGKPVYALEGSIAVAGSGVKFLMRMLRISCVLKSFTDESYRQLGLQSCLAQDHRAR